MTKLPAGWDEDRVERVIKHYENQGEDEAVAEDEAAFAVDEILVQVPVELVPKVRALIAKEQAKR
jgi:type II secretory pathway component PulC